MIRLIAMLSIVALLAGFGIAEELYVQNVLGALKTNAAQIEEMIIASDEETVSDPEITKKVDDTADFWDKNQRTLTFIVNFEKIKPITETLEKLKVAIGEEDYSLSIENATLLRFYSEHLTFVMGSDITNIL